MEFKHKSVLLDETIEGLSIRPDGIYVDGTLGGAGHASEVCQRLSAKGRFIGIDQDQDAIIAASERLAAYEDRVTIIRSNYCYMVNELKNLGIQKVDGIVLDLGVSSYQLDNEERGFTYRVDAPLDMRMDQRQSRTAADIVNGYDEKELYRIIRDYGEDKFAKNIAKHIVAARAKAPIQTTGELTEIIRQSIPMKIQATGGHPAKRTFQAIRIELNRELDVLRESLDGMIDLLDDGGRICIITFHSLEDRIVKTIFRKNENPCTCPPDFPVCVCGKESKGKVITRKPILPSKVEMEENPRSKSAKLRGYDESYHFIKEELEDFVDCARYAPSSVNAQPFRYYLAWEKEEVSRIQKLTNWARALPQMKLPHPGMCPTGFIIICQDLNLGASIPRYQKDVGIVAQTMLLAAAEKGLGGCMIGNYNADSVRKELNLAENLAPVLIVAFGKPAEKIIIKEIEEGENIAYYRDENDVHYVPKRKLSDILIKK